MSFIGFLAYLKTKGVDPKAIGLLKELERIKNVINRQKLVSDKEKAPKIDVTAVSTFFKNFNKGIFELCLIKFITIFLF